MRKIVSVRNSLILLIPLAVIVSAAKYSSVFNTRLVTSGSTQRKVVELKSVLSVPNTGFVDIAMLRNGRIVAASIDDRESKYLYLSDNGGVSWRKVTLPIGGAQGISFVDEMHGWIVTYGAVLKSEDGGETWSQIGKPTKYPLSVVKFINLQVGYAAGGAERGCQIFRTSDGGKTWTKIYENFEGGTVFDLEALDQETVIGAINDAFLLRSEDSGTTWQKIEIGIRGASALAVGPGSIVWLVGRRASFCYSIDKGRTWEPVVLPNSSMNTDWISIAFSSAQRGVAVGKKGVIVVSDDGGKSWLETRADVADDLRRIQVNEESALITGSHAVYRLDLSHRLSEAKGSH